MRVTVRLFARLRDLAGAGQLERQVQAPATVSHVWNELVREFPALAPYTSSISGAVNAEYARMDAPVGDGDEVAFLPPVSGGSRRGRTSCRSAVWSAGLLGPPNRCSTN